MIGDWSESPAGLVANRNRGLAAEVPGERRAREFFGLDHQRAVAEHQAAVDADPSWKFARAMQADIASRGWPGTWVSIGPTRPPELAPLFAAQSAQATTVGVFTSGDGPDGEYRRMMSR